VRASSVRTITERLFTFGVITALYHDCGYIRHRKDTKHANGAEYTATHVSRGARFVEEYFPKIGMADLAQTASRVIHYTGYEVPVDRIRVPGPEFRLIGSLLGSADILAQMADRCYLEKCYDRLYPEFVRGGIATKRLKQDLGGCYNYIEQHFGGQNIYFDELEKNINHARSIAVEGDISLLRRRPPKTVEGAEEQGQPRLI
jgi:hypothetical protein